METWLPIRTLGQFSADKTKRRHSEGIVPNIFIRKSTIARPIMGLRTTFELLPVLSGFPVIKPEVENFGVNFVFFSK